MIDDIGSIFAQLDREIWLVTAAAGDRRGGLIATFVSQASIASSLPRVAVGLAKHHYTWELIREAGAFGLHLLDENQLDWVWRFGLSSGRNFDKLEGVASERGTSGSPLLTDALAWLDCRVETSLDTGDRTLYLAEVVAGRLRKAAQPLTMRRLLQLAPANRLSELKDQLTRDAAVDAAAIQKWRQAL
jgi:flavin reductase (DIM6/NTAB) family NADH-FMN oxidoreductase RutF